MCLNFALWWCIFGGVRVRDSACVGISLPISELSASWDKELDFHDVW